MLTLRGKIVLTILILLLLATGYYLYIYLYSDSIFSHHVRQPRYQVPVTYNIDWWPYQNDVTIDSLNVEIIDSKLNLFNSKSLVSYKIFGHVTFSNYWYPSIEKIFISERYDSTVFSNSLPPGSKRIIELMPVVTVDYNEERKHGNIPFVVKNEHLITSTDWGRNYIRFVCGKLEKTISLMQRK